jgi:hypothetical protein
MANRLKVLNMDFRPSGFENIFCCVLKKRILVLELCFYPMLCAYESVRNILIKAETEFI